MSTGTVEKSISKWDWRYFLLAQHVASWSKDSTQVGAVIIGADPRHIAVGYNGFPPRVQDYPSRYNDRQLKYVFVQHAERNVLDNASFSCVGATLVSTHFPCVECTKSLISKGIRRLITTPPPKPIGEPSWRDLLEHAIVMLNEAGVEVVLMDGTGW